MEAVLLLLPDFFFYRSICPLINPPSFFFFTFLFASREKVTAVELINQRVLINLVFAHTSHLTTKQPINSANYLLLAIGGDEVGQGLGELE